MRELEQVVREMTERVRHQMESELSRSLEEIRKGVLQEAEKAYKAGRAIIASETVDRFSQYTNNLLRSIEELERTADSISLDLFDKYRKVYLSEPYSAEGHHRVAQTLPKLIEYIGEIRQQIQEEVRELHEQVEHIREYLLTMHRITAVPEWITATKVGELARHVLARKADDLAACAIEARVVEQEPITAMVSGPKLKRVIRGLVENAIQAMRKQPSHLPRRLSIDIDRHEDQVRIEVTDTGPGIPEKDRKHIFAISYGQHSATFSLYFFSAIMQQMGGRLYLSEKPLDCGSCFVILTPLSRRDE